MSSLRSSSPVTVRALLVAVTLSLLAPTTAATPVTALGRPSAASGDTAVPTLAARRWPQPRRARTAAAAGTGVVAPPGPPLLTPQAVLDRAVRCTSDVTDPEAPTPVLLVHGAGGTAAEAWSRSWVPELTGLGHPVCTVDLPLMATGDVQQSVEHVVNAVRRISDGVRRPISVLGLSMGALQSTYAMRLWPDLERRVDDVIGLAGVYLPGSQRIADVCARPEGCVPAFHQVERGAELLGRLAAWPLPNGTDYSLIATVEDRTVTPQPSASVVAGATTLFVEQVCPGRGDRFALSHGTFLGDAVAHRLVLDALDHPGPADVRRIDPVVCEEHYFPGFDLDAHQRAQRPGRPFAVTTVAPATRCYLSRSCVDAASRGRVTHGARVRVNRRRLVYTATVVRAGSVELTFAGRRTTRSVVPGPLRMSIARPRDPRHGGSRAARRRPTLEVSTGLPHYTDRAPELVVRIPVRRR